MNAETGNILIGQLGERLTVSYLKKRGYEIIERNYRTHFGEIDIIARDGKCLVFIEVKTRTSDNFGGPFESVNHFKKVRIRRAAGDYLSNSGGHAESIRFDVVGILLTEEADPEIRQIQNAFYRGEMP